MKSTLGFAFVALLVTFVACSQDKKEENPYPVWILYANAVEEVSDIGVPFAPVRGCPQAVFRVLPTGSDSTVGCENHSNVVKIWNHIDSVVTIEYYMRCPNYYDSETRQYTFRADRAVRGPGRDGPEDIKRDTLVLVPL